MNASRPLIGVTPDLVEDRVAVRSTYLDAVRSAGGLPMMLSGNAIDVDSLVLRCDGFLLTGGDDPIMEAFGIETHPEARPIDPHRQAFELALLDALEGRPEVPVLGVCLGMQLMGLKAGGQLDQHLPDSLETAVDHADGRLHPVEGVLGEGVVWSRHRQAITDPGRLQVVARAEDGVIEAIESTDRAMYLGVQWHPERTEDERLGRDIFRRLVERSTAVRS